MAGNLGNLHLDMNHFATSASNFAGQAYLSLLIAIGGAYLGLLDNDLLPISIYTSVVSTKGAVASGGCCMPVTHHGYGLSWLAGVHHRHPHLPRELPLL